MPCLESCCFLVSLHAAGPADQFMANFVVTDHPPATKQAKEKKGKDCLMTHLSLRTALVTVLASVALAGCASTQSVHRAQADANAATEQARAGAAAAKQAQASADAAAVAAQRAQASADGAGTAAQNASTAAQAVASQQQANDSKVAALENRVRRLEQWKKAQAKKHHHKKHHKARHKAAAKTATK